MEFQEEKNNKDGCGCNVGLHLISRWMCVSLFIHGRNVTWVHTNSAYHFRLLTVAYSKNVSDKPYNVTAESVLALSSQTYSGYIFGRIKNLC